MTVEYIRYHIPRRHAEGFRTAYAAATAVLQADPQCLSYEVSQSPPDSANFLVRIEWSAERKQLKDLRSDPAFTDFFALIPGDLSAAHALTSPAFQAEFPLDRFSGFWDDFSSVQISNVESEDATTALVDITYGRPDGSSETERHRITFVEGDDGQLLLDNDAIA